MGRLSPQVRQIVHGDDLAFQIQEPLIGVQPLEGVCGGEILPQDLVFGPLEGQKPGDGDGAALLEGLQLPIQLLQGIVRHQHPGHQDLFPVVDRLIVAAEGREGRKELGPFLPAHPGMAGFRTGLVDDVCIRSCLYLYF